MENIDINKIVVSNEVFFVKKDFSCFIYYKNASKNYIFMNIPSKNECI